jgi:tetratricopeptide (TPR) repeat protein
MNGLQKKTIGVYIFLSLISAAALTLGGCATEPGEMTGIGAATGGALGAGLGALVGAQTGDTGSGLVLGGLAGSATGSLIANNLEANQESIDARNDMIQRQEQLLDSQKRDIEEYRRTRDAGAGGLSQRRGVSSFENSKNNNAVRKFDDWYGGSRNNEASKTGSLPLSPTKQQYPSQYNGQNLAYAPQNRQEIRPFEGASRNQVQPRTREGMLGRSSIDDQLKDGSKNKPFQDQNSSNKPSSIFKPIESGSLIHSNSQYNSENAVDDETHSNSKQLRNNQQNKEQPDYGLNTQRQSEGEEIDSVVKQWSKGDDAALPKASKMDLPKKNDLVKKTSDYQNQVAANRINSNQVINEVSSKKTSRLGSAEMDKSRISELKSAGDENNSDFEKNRKAGLNLPQEDSSFQDEEASSGSRSFKSRSGGTNGSQPHEASTLKKISSDQDAPQTAVEGKSVLGSTDLSSKTDCELGEQEIKNGDSESESGQKLFHYRRALRLCPDNPKFHYKLGNEYISQKRYTDAETEFKEALKLDKEFNPAREKLGEIKNIKQ